MKKSKRMCIAVVAVCLAIHMAAPYSFADAASDETAALKAEIALLKERLNSLEAKVVKTETKTADLEVRTASAEKTHSAPQSGAESVVTSFAKEIQVHGFVDTSYIFNTNTPVAPNARTNNLRVFDTEANGFMLNMAEINFEKPVSLESPVGFRFDLDVGDDAKLIHSSGMGLSTNDVFDLKQAYVQLQVPFRLPYMYALDFKVGKYSTLLGAEVIESVNNWSFSRSYLFGYAIPFTHTGIRAHYKPFESSPVEGYLGIVNGWDNVVDNNKAKSVEGQILITPNDKFSFAIGGVVGAERYDSDKDMRAVVDLVATYNVTPKLTLKVNYDYGWEKNGAEMLPNSGSPSTNVTPITSTGLENKDAQWQGVAGYARYTVLDWWAVALRGEYFVDPEGVRTGVYPSIASGTNLWEFTLTNEFTLYKNIIARIEYRYDKASDQVFTKDKVTANNQSTIAAELIARF